MSIFKSLGTILRDILPTFAAALPIPGLKSIAVKVLTDVFNLPPETSENKLVDAIQNMTPAQLIELQSKQIELNEAAMNVGVDLEKLAVQDRDSARNRQIQLKDDTPNVLAYVVLAFTMIFTFAVVFFNSPHISENLVYFVLGNLFAIVASIIAYYFGSSKSDSKKDHQLTGNITPDVLQQVMSFTSKSTNKSN